MTISLTLQELGEAAVLARELGLNPSAEVWLDRTSSDDLILTEAQSGEVFPVMLMASRDSRVRQWRKVNR